MKTLFWDWLGTRQICSVKACAGNWRAFSARDVFLLFLTPGGFVSFFHWSDFKCRLLCPQFLDYITSMLLLHILPCLFLPILKLHKYSILFSHLKFMLWVDIIFQQSVSFGFCKVLTSVDFSLCWSGFLLLPLLLQTLTSLYCMNEKQQRAPFLPLSPPPSFSVHFRVCVFDSSIVLCFEATLKNIK